MRLPCGGALLNKPLDQAYGWAGARVGEGGGCALLCRGAGGVITCDKEEASLWRGTSQQAIGSGVRVGRRLGEWKGERAPFSVGGRWGDQV